MCEGYKFRLFATTDGKTYDELIEENMIKEAVAFIEVELVAISEELARIREALDKIKAKLGVEVWIEQ
jgi:hypothetical protein